MKRPRLRFQSPLIEPDVRISRIWLSELIRCSAFGGHVDAFPAPFPARQHVGVAVRTAGGASGLIGSAGACGWSGGYKPYSRIGPKKELIFMLFVQQAYVPGDQGLLISFHNTVMQALVD